MDRTRNANIKQDDNYVLRSDDIYFGTLDTIVKILYKIEIDAKQDHIEPMVETEVWSGFGCAFEGDEGDECDEELRKIDDDIYSPNYDIENDIAFVGNGWKNWLRQQIARNRSIDSCVFDGYGFGLVAKNGQVRWFEYEQMMNTICDYLQIKR